MLWIWATTLAAAIARQSAEIGLHPEGAVEAWGEFRQSIEGLEIEPELLIQFDLAEERGELPPGWIVDPELGVFHLYNAVVHVVDDDTDPRKLEILLNRDLEKGWTPVQLFVHANPSSHLEPEDIIDFYVVDIFLELGREQRKKRKPDEAPREIFNRIVGDIRKRRSVLEQRGTIAMFYNRRAGIEAFMRGFNGFEGSTIDLFRDLERAGFVDPPEESEEWLVWYPETTQQMTPAFNETIELLSRSKILPIGEDITWPTFAPDTDDLTEFYKTAGPSIRALKLGFAIAQVPELIRPGQKPQDTTYMNVLIRPVPELGERLFPSISNKGADLEASEWMHRLPAKIER